jgi:hypothetical protein
MADKKVSQLTALTTTAAPDLLLIVDDPNGTPLSKKVTIKTFFGAVPANTVFTANVTTRGNRVQHASDVVVTKATTVNTFITTLKTTPSTNNATTESLSVGQMFFTNTHLYIAVNATTIKRVALTTF